MAQVNSRKEKCNTFLKRMGMTIVSLAQIESPLKEVELPIFQAGDIFGGSLEVEIAANAQGRLEFVFETNRSFVRVPLYGFFKKFIVGDYDGKDFSKSCDTPKYSGEGFNAIKKIYQDSLNERDFVVKMLVFFKSHQLHVASAHEDMSHMVKFGPHPGDVKKGYTTYTLDFA